MQLPAVLWLVGMGAALGLMLGGIVVAVSITADDHPSIESVRPDDCFVVSVDGEEPEPLPAECFLPETHSGATPVDTSTFPWSYGVINSGLGPCHDPSIEVVDPSIGERVYHEGETLTVDIRYDAPGCETMAVTFGGRHLKGSPRYEYYCTGGEFRDSPGLGVCDEFFRSNIFADHAALSDESGVITMVARPGGFPPESLESDADLEGFQLCSVVVTVTDGLADGSSSHEQINLGCPDEHGLRPISIDTD